MHDDKFGARAQTRAIRYGDAIIPLIIGESGNFRLLNNRNAFWIAEVIGSNRSELARSVGQDLYSRPDHLSQLAGAVALAEQGALNSTGVNELITTISRRHEGPDVELAILAVGKARSVVASPALIGVLSTQKGDYWTQAYACDAIARIGEKGAIPILRACLRRQTFYALPNAFRALITLGDREAVPLAIVRISPEIRDDNSGYVVKELERITGQRFGYDRPAWMKWWESVERTWTIPARFLTPFDNQPQVY